MSIEVINRKLYETLRIVFGDVVVGNLGDYGTFDSRDTYVNPVTGELCRRSMSPGGETYKVCCPFCNDDHFHLYVSYRYGTRDVEGHVNKLAHCFHGCLEQPDHRETLYYWITQAVRLKQSRKIRQARKEAYAQLTGPVGMPEVIPLLDLPEDHIAVQYIRSRNFTPEYLSKYKVGYCENSESFMTRGRLIIPIIVNGESLGWQARKLDFTKAGPKYYTSTGLAVGRILYNIDNAIKQPYVVLTEGVADTWRVGDAGVCLFGKSLSEGQRRLVLSSWVGKPVVVLLDRDATNDAIKICKKLAPQHSGPVILGTLPEGYGDPGESDAGKLQEAILKSLKDGC